MNTNRFALTILLGLPLALPGQTLSQQAQIQANRFWSRLTRCGDTAYVAFKNGEVDAFKNAQIVVQAQPLNEADRLNGWEWKGVTGFTATATRMWVAHETLGVDGPLGWQQWVPGTGPAGMFGVYTASVEKLHGAWRVVPNPVGPWNEMRTFDCSQIPPERFDPNSALVQKEMRDTTCRRFMSAAGDGSPIAGWDQVESLRYWINKVRDRSGQDVPGPGMDPRTCRDDQGNTVLMKLAWDPSPPVDAVQYLLSIGVDINAKNNAGETAMSLAQKRLDLMRKGAWGITGDSDAINKVISLLQNAILSGPSAPRAASEPVSVVRPVQPTLALRVERSAGQLVLKWNREADVVLDAQRATLTITDGDHTQDVTLDLGQLRGGSIVYSPISADVGFRLEVVSRGGNSTSQSVRVLGAPRR